MILDPNGLSVAAGQLEGADQAAAQEQSAQAAQADQASFLLFRAGGRELKAIPLELVSRIESLDASDHRACRRPPGGPVPPASDAAGALRSRPCLEGPAASRMCWCSATMAAAMGLAVDEVVDIVRERMTVELSSSRPGLLGSAIIAGKAVDVVDAGHFLTQAFSDWFEVTAACRGPARAAGGRQPLLPQSGGAAADRRQLAGHHRLGRRRSPEAARERPDISTSSSATSKCPIWTAWRWPAPSAAMTAGATCR